VASESAVQRTFNSILDDLGSIDVLVTAAGIVDNVAAEHYGYERWKRMFDVNLNGTFLCAREAGRWMLGEGRKGSIILVGSMSGFICVRPQKQAAYNAVSVYELV
jgi:sorbose reductase